MGLQYTPTPGVGSPVYIDLASGLPNPAHQEGRIFYDDTNKTLAVYNNESDVTLQLGQEMYFRVYNATGVAIANGALVFINGAFGGRPTVALAKADSPSTTGVIAMATHEIGITEEGFVTTFGSVGDLNTNSWAIGTVLYLSSTNAGEWTSTAPVAPNFPIQIGTVLAQGVSDGKILISIGPTDVAQTMVIQDLEINEDLRVDKKFTLNPSAVTNITAVGGITPTNATMLVQGDGGPITITASPQIAAGTKGQILLIHGESDTNTITFHDGDGIHLHSGSQVILGNHDYLLMQYMDAGSSWGEIASNFPVTEKSWSFSSPINSSGTFYIGGFYLLGSTNFTPAGGTNLGTANAAYGAHAFLVLGAVSTDMVVRVTGTSVDELGNRTSDTEDLDTSGGAVDDYFETTKKWVGQISYSLQSGTGVTINNGMCKYWDNRNSDFRISAFEITGLAGASDSGPNFTVYHHKPTGWTYNVGAEPTPPTPIADMNTDYVTEIELINDEHFAWKRTGLNEVILGSSNEGCIGEIITTANRAVEFLDWQLSIRPH